MIRNVVLDIGNVLAKFRWKEVMEDLGFSKEVIEALQHGMIMSPLWKELDKGVIDHNKVVAMFKENNPTYEKEINLFFQDVEELVRQFDYTEAFIKELKDKGIV